MAQQVKNLPVMQETRVQYLGWEHPLEKGMATHSSILAWKIPWTEESGELQSLGLQRVRHDWANKRIPSLQWDWLSLEHLWAIDLERPWEEEASYAIGENTKCKELHENSKYVFLNKVKIEQADDQAFSHQSI